MKFDKNIFKFALKIFFIIILTFEVVLSSIIIGNDQIVTSKAYSKDLFYEFEDKKINFLDFNNLTIVDKKNINENKNIKSITIIFDPHLIDINDELDISWVREDITINFSTINSFSIKEIEEVYLFTIYNKIDDKNRNKINFKANKLSLSDLERWNQYLTNIVSSFNFNEDITNEEKIIKIVSYVTDVLTYDPNYIDNAKEYNNNIIKTTLDNVDGYGICCNYAAFTTLLGFYSNISLDYTIGKYNNSSVYHAYITYNSLDYKSIIDPTALDNNNRFNKLKIN